MCLCVVSGWSRLVLLCLCGSVWFSAGLCLFRCVCMVMRSFGVLSTVFAAFVCSVLFLVGFGWFRCACVVVWLCGFLLVCACLAAFVWFCVVLCCCELFFAAFVRFCVVPGVLLLRLCVSVLYGFGVPRLAKPRRLANRPVWQTAPFGKPPGLLVLSG